MKTTFQSPYLAVFLSSILLQTSDDFMRKVRERIGGSNPYSVTGYVESPLAYDAVWALALALNKTQNRLLQRGESLENFKYSNENIMKEIYSAMNSTGFLGISVSRDTALQMINTNIYSESSFLLLAFQGRVAFSSQGDRIAWTQIEQMWDGNYTKMGFYDYGSDNLTSFGLERWPGK